MRHTQLITYGVDEAAAERLTALVRDRAVGLRVTHNAQACLNLMRQGAVGVLLLRIGKNLESEFTLLAQVAQQFPQIAPVVWGGADHPRLAGLAWDLGAQAVLLTPGDHDRLYDVILRLLPD